MYEMMFDFFFGYQIEFFWEVIVIKIVLKQIEKLLKIFRYVEFKIFLYSNDF